MIDKSERSPVEITVLVVDDSLVDRHKASGIISQSLGWRVLHAADGRAALAEVERSRPDVVLTDLQMPELDGLALVRELHNKLPFLPVVLMTAYGSEDIAVDALRNGASSYVPKRNLGQDLPETLSQVIAAAAAGRQRHQLVRDCLRVSEAHFELSNDPNLLRAMVSRLQDDLDSMDICRGGRRIQIGIALEEALTNAMYHGNLEVSSDLRHDGDTGAYRRLADERRKQAPYATRKLHVRTFMTPALGEIRIQDEGPGFDPGRLPDPTDPENMARACGRGLLLIRTFVDEVEFNKSGNEITLRVRQQVIDSDRSADSVGLSEGDHVTR